MTEALETQVKSKVTIKVKALSVGFDSNSCISCVMDRFDGHILPEIFRLRCDFLFLGKLRSEFYEEKLTREICFISVRH